MQMMIYTARYRVLDASVNYVLYSLLNLSTIISEHQFIPTHFSAVAQPSFSAY